MPTDYLFLEDQNGCMVYVQNIFGHYFKSDQAWPCVCMRVYETWGKKISDITSNWIKRGREHMERPSRYNRVNIISGQ